MKLAAEDGDLRKRYKVVRCDTYRELAEGSEIVSSNDEQGTCVLMIPKRDSSGFVVRNSDGSPEMEQQSYDLSSGCGIATILR